MERLFLFTARKYADSGGRCDEAFGAFSERGAAGGLHNPIECISYTEKKLDKIPLNEYRHRALLPRPL